MAGLEPISSDEVSSELSNRGAIVVTLLHSLHVLVITNVTHRNETAQGNVPCERRTEPGMEPGSNIIFHGWLEEDELARKMENNQRGRKNSRPGKEGTS